MDTEKRVLARALRDIAEMFYDLCREHGYTSFSIYGRKDSISFDVRDDENKEAFHSLTTFETREEADNG